MPRKRKLDSKNKNLNFIEKIKNVDRFLDLAESTLNDDKSVNHISRSNKEIFVSLSDVSTDESDIEVVGTSKFKQSNIGKSKATANDALKAKQKFNAFLNSLDYLTKPPLCVIKPTNDFLRFEVLSTKSDYDSSDSSDDSKCHDPVTLDNGDCFIIDSESVKPNFSSEMSIDNSEGNIEKGKHKRKRKSQKRFPDNPELKNEPRMFKYWSQRYNLFERFDMGIKLDRESWFSVTPEYIAKEHAELCDESDVVLDGFCGAGGNTIQFAYRCQKVYGLDIDNNKVKLTEHNCQVYGVSPEKVTVMNEDYYSYCSFYDPNCAQNVIKFPRISVVYLSPPWGGQDYLVNDDNQATFNLASIDMTRLMTSARLLNPRLIIVFLPRNTDTQQLYSYTINTDTLDIVKHSAHYKENNKSKKVKAITAVYRLK